LSCCGSGFRGIGRNITGGANGCGWDIRIETMEDGQEIGGAEGEADAGEGGGDEFEIGVEVIGFD